jgi:N-acylneuraminate cytidylyltransferase
MKPIVIIPARGGSKRIPRKNIKLMAGKPIIGYTIQNAIKSGLFERVFVSTDDPEIAEISKSFGAEVPFLRESSLSDDFATTGDVIADAIKKLGRKFETVEFICCIYPVTPLLKFERIAQAIERLQNEAWDYVFAGQIIPVALERSFRLDSTGALRIQNQNNFDTRTQDLSPPYFDAGQFYLGHRISWIDRKPILGSNSTIIKMNRFEAIDVDTLDDWDDMETLIELRLFMEGK